MAGSEAFLQALSEAHDWCEALGHDAVRVRHGLLVTDPAYPEVWSANHMSGVRASTPSQIDEALAELEAAFAGAPCLVVDADALTPPAFLARLAMEGFEEQPAVVLMTLDGSVAQASAPPEFEILPVDSEAGWRDLQRLHQINCEEAARTGSVLSQAVVEGLFHGLRQKSGPGRFFLGWLDGRACASASAIAAPGGFGLVDDVFTLPEHRRQGIAAAMVAHCVEHLRDRGAGRAFLTALVRGRPKHLYARLGFAPVMLARRWVKTLD